MVLVRSRNHFPDWTTSNEDELFSVIRESSIEAMLPGIVRLVCVYRDGLGRA